ncbi:hypothetical protein D3C73_1472410 [compost metagenome]
MVQLLGCFPDAADALRVLVQLSVGKVQAGDVHAGLDQPQEHFGAFAGGTDGADDFSFAHGFFLSLLFNVELL